jgi:membrane protease subunit HflK
MYYETMEQVMAHSDKTIVEAPGVVPYLPLPGAARRAPDVQAQPTQTPAPVQGDAQ